MLLFIHFFEPGFCFLGFYFPLGFAANSKRNSSYLEISGERRLEIEEVEMPLGLILGIGRAMRRKRTSSLDILSSKRAPRNYYKGKNCKPTGFHTRKGGYVVMDEKLPRYVVPDLSDFKLKPYVAQCPREATTTEAADPPK
ncbi:uncharacterized protein LOC143887207 isoform X1 [Tasmannia lanceolata]|uniref:uncharacterized protein LOC143887207 isoform X1 n=2 Tax=Tasmannia lanceolata TaxID=3420 RepID=UPI00406385A1